MPLFGPPNIDKMKAKRDLKGLVKMLGSGGDLDSRRAVAQALDELGWQPERDEAGAAYWLAKSRWDQCVQVGAPAIKPLVAMLRAKSPDAARALGEIGDGRAVDPLVGALCDPLQNIDTRLAAAWALLEIGAEAVNPLHSMLKGTEEKKAQVAAWALAAIGAPSVEALVSTLKSFGFNPRAPACAAQALGYIGDSRAVQPLCVEMLDFSGSSGAKLIPPTASTDPHNRLAAIAALGRIGDLQAMPALLASATWSKDSAQRDAAAVALVRIGGPAVDLIVEVLADLTATRAKLGEQGDMALREGLGKVTTEGIPLYIRVLGIIGDPRVAEPLVIAALDGYFAEAAVALKKIDPARAVELLVAALENGEPVKRVRAALTLGQMGDPRAVEPLIAAIKHEDAELSKAAIKTLGQMGDSRAVEPLIDVVKNRINDRMAEAIEALGLLGDARAVEPLLAFLWKCMDPGISQAAYYALGKLKDPRAVQPLIDALRSSSETVRLAATSSLAELGDPRAVDMLISIAESGNLLTCQAAIGALRRLKSDRAVDYFIDALKKQVGQPSSDRAAVVLGGLGDARAVEPLIAVLNATKGKSPSSSAAALAALVQIGDMRATAPLRAILNNTWDTLWNGACEALVKLGDKQAGDRLLTCFVKNVNNKAGWALGQIGDIRSVEPFIYELGAFSAERRRVSAEGLAKLGDPRALDPLIVRLMVDADAGVRKYAALGLARIGGEKAVKHLLISALMETDQEVRWVTAWSLATALGANVKFDAMTGQDIQETTTLVLGLVAGSAEETGAESVQAAGAAEMPGGETGSLEYGQLADTILALAAGLELNAGQYPTAGLPEVAETLKRCAAYVRSAGQSGGEEADRFLADAVLELGGAWFQFAMEETKSYSFGAMSRGIGLDRSLFMSDAARRIKELERKVMVLAGR